MRRRFGRRARIKGETENGQKGSDEGYGLFKKGHGIKLGHPLFSAIQSRRGHQKEEENHDHAAD